MIHHLSVPIFYGSSLRDVEKRSENVNIEIDHRGWHPYIEFVNHMKERCAKNEGFQGQP